MAGTRGARLRAGCARYRMDAPREEGEAGPFRAQVRSQIVSARGF